MITTNSHIKYAHALHKVAAAGDAAETVLRDLEMLSQLYGDDRFRALLKQIAWLEKVKLEEVLKATFRDRAHAITLNMLVLLGRARKLPLVPRIFKVYSHIFHTAKKIEEIKVCTARKLDGDEELAMIDRLQQQLDKPVSVRFKVSPGLIGGVQIYERGYVTDYSIKNYLETLEKHLLDTEN
jgi:F-type H+-transporting ATPase subunit delta